MAVISRYDQSINLFTLVAAFHDHVAKDSEVNCVRNGPKI